MIRSFSDNGKAGVTMLSHVLLDLLPESGPRSADIYLAEDADLSWTRVASRDVA